MPLSKWDKFEVEEKITKVLNVKSNPSGHHFKQPFMTSYQIAICLDKQYGLVKAMGKPIGGKGTGQHNSLAQYIARELSTRIKKKRISRIEGAFLYRGYLKTLQYKQNIENSLGESWDLSMYRLIK